MKMENKSSNRLRSETVIYGLGTFVPIAFLIGPFFYNFLDKLPFSLSNYAIAFFLFFAIFWDIAHYIEIVVEIIRNKIQILNILKRMRLSLAVWTAACILLIWHQCTTAEPVASFLVEEETDGVFEAFLVTAIIEVLTTIHLLPFAVSLLKEISIKFEGIVALASIVLSIVVILLAL